MRLLNRGGAQLPRRLGGSRALPNVKQTPCPEWVSLPSLCAESAIPNDMAALLRNRNPLPWLRWDRAVGHLGGRASPRGVTGLTGIRSLGGGTSASSRLWGEPAASGQLRGQGPASEGQGSHRSALGGMPAGSAPPPTFCGWLPPAAQGRVRGRVTDTAAGGSHRHTGARFLSRPQGESASPCGRSQYGGQCRCSMAQRNLVTGAERQGGFNPAGWLRGPLS